MLKHIIPLAFLVFSLPTFPNDDNTLEEFVPASIKDSRMSIEKLIKFPRKHEKSKEDIAVVIRCDAVIKRNGKVDHNF